MLRVIARSLLLFLLLLLVLNHPQKGVLKLRLDACASRLVLHLRFAPQLQQKFCYAQQSCRGQKPGRRSCAPLYSKTLRAEPRLNIQTLTFKVDFVLPKQFHDAISHQPARTQAKMLLQTQHYVQYQYVIRPLLRRELQLHGRSPVLPISALATIVLESVH